MSNKSEREFKEMMSVFTDPKTMRTAWRSVGAAILQNPATKPVIVYNKDGDETYASQVENYTYEKLKHDIVALGQPQREPTELEMIMGCQIIRARNDTSAATFVRDTLGAKPVDESKVEQTVNAFESLTDEELELLAAHRAALQEGVDTTAPASGDTPALPHSIVGGETDTDGNT